MKNDKPTILYNAVINCDSRLVQRLREWIAKPHIMETTRDQAEGILGVIVSFVEEAAS